MLDVEGALDRPPLVIALDMLVARDREPLAADMPVVDVKGNDDTDENCDEAYGEVVRLMMSSSLTVCRVVKSSTPGNTRAVGACEPGVTHDMPLVGVDDPALPLGKAALCLPGDKVVISAKMP